MLRYAALRCTRHAAPAVQIQDTLRQPPSAVGTMKKAVNVAVTGAFLFYFVVAVAGYVSLGNGERGGGRTGSAVGPGLPAWRAATQSAA